MTDQSTDASPAQACKDPYIKRRLLWHSDRDGGETISYYADKLWLLHVDDGKWCLQLDVGGKITVHPIKNIEKYV